MPRLIMEIGRRATAPDMQNALVPGSENSRWYGEWVADDLDTARAGKQEP